MVSIIQLMVSIQLETLNRPRLIQTDFLDIFYEKFSIKPTQSQKNFDAKISSVTID